MTDNRPMQTRNSLHQIPAALAVVMGLLIANASAQSYLMPAGSDGKQPFDPNPAASGSLTRKVITYGTDPDGNKVPLKTVRITNNSDNTLYPVMINPNTTTLPTDPSIGLYNPYDPIKKDYRGYIGYKGDDGQYYFGLKAGQSILAPIPLAFWDGSRMAVEADGQYLTVKKKGDRPNPMGYDPTATISITLAETSAETIKNGVVMWYRAEVSKVPGDDDADSYVEWTIRDHAYLTNPQITQRTKSEIPDGQLLTLINYDVSSVDSLYVPLAMQALDVWVMPQTNKGGANPNRTSWEPGSIPDIYGWTGSVQTVDFLQKNIRDFTADNSKLLGKYFAGKGWPFFNIPNPSDNPKQLVKIPGGADIFADSPLKPALGSYYAGTSDSTKYMLSSGGTGPIGVTIGWSGGTPDKPGSSTVHLTKSDDLKSVSPGAVVTANPAPKVSNPIQPGTTVQSVDIASNSVVLSKPLIAPTADCSFSFTRPVDDYAADALIRLWYSWAQYYLTNWKSKNPLAPTSPVQIAGSMNAEEATISFKDPQPTLVEGMAVTGLGLDNANTDSGPHQGDAVILEISSDKKSVIVSQVAREASSNAPYTFSPPKQLIWTPKKEGDAGFPLFGDKFEFSNVPEWQDPYYFSQKVYLIMAYMNQIDKTNNDYNWKFMNNVIGADLSYAFDAKGQASADGQMVIAMTRDLIKSVLRGVYDFKKFPDTVDAKGNHTCWYPDPSLPTGGQPFNVFNLDPYVWFVHVKLGFSSYGFSVDDDVSDIGASGANHLQVSIAGAGGLKPLAPKGPYPWTVQAPFGAIVNYTATYSGDPANGGHGATVPHNIKSASTATPMVVTTAEPHQLTNNATILINNISGNLGAKNGTYTIKNPTKYTFELYDEAGQPVSPSGQTGNAVATWSLPLRPFIETGADLSKVWYRVAIDDPQGTFLGTPVYLVSTPEKVGDNVRFSAWGLQSTGQIILNAALKNGDGTDVPAGTYQFTFGDVAKP